MSASKDRQIRKQQIEAGTYKRTKAEEEAAKKQRKTRIQYTIIAVVLVVVFAFIFLYNSALPAKMSTAVTIDGEKYSVAQMNYYYSTSYMNFYNTYNMYVMYGMAFDTSTALDEQYVNDTMLGSEEYADDYTWRDYFIDAGIDTMTQVQALNKAADEAGFELTDADRAEYEEALESLRTSWKDLGYSSLRQYLSLNYGKGVDMKLVEKEMYRSFRASAYAESVEDSFTYSAAELDAYHTEHADELDNITYASYVQYADDAAAEDAVVVDMAALAAAVNGTSEEEFVSYMEENYDGLTPTTTTDAGEYLPELFADWLLGDRTAGDTIEIAAEDGNQDYVVMFLDRDAGDYKTVDFRHILLMAEDADGDGLYSEEELAAAEARAEDVYDEWQNGAKTEESFAALADEYTEDTGSTGNGGLYENTYKGQMVAAIDEWLFADGRQPGDTTIVTNDGGYTGAHVVYYVGQSDLTYAQVQADGILRDEAFSEWIEGLTDASSVVRGSLKLAGTNR